MPRLNNLKSRWETSVYRVAGLTDSEGWKLGYQNVEKEEAKRKVKARGIGSFQSATTSGLGLDVNGPPYPRHVDVIGWSADDKDVRLMRATEIAETLVLEVDRRP